MHRQLIDCGSDRGRVQSVWMHCPLLVAAIADARFSTVLASRNSDSILHVNQSGGRCVRDEDRIESIQEQRSRRCLKDVAMVLATRNIADSSIP